MIRPAHHYVPELARAPWWRRWLRRGALVVAFGSAAAWGLQPGTASADTLSGWSTGGCVQQAVIFSGATTNVSSYNISFRASIGYAAGATVVMSHWWQLPNGSTGPVHYVTGDSERQSGGAAGTTVYVLPGQVNVDRYGFRVRFAAGTTGLARHVVVVQAYNGSGCATIDNVRVDRILASGGATPPPGGGGFVATPTPAVPEPTPTTPALGTPIPGATPGPSNVCDPTWRPGTTGSYKCYPKPPAGWCYQFTTNAEPILTECDTPPTPPPTPTPPPPSLTTCDGITFTWCFAPTGAGGTTQTFPLTGTAGALPQTISIGGWSYTTGPGGSTWRAITSNITCASGTTSQTHVAGAAKDGSGGDLPPDWGHVFKNWQYQTGGSTWVNHVGGVRERYLTGSYSFNCGAGVGLQVTFVFPTTAASSYGWVWFAEAGPLSSGPTPPPTGPPASPTPAPTLPDDYWGCPGCTPPPQNGGGLEPGDPVDICTSNPGILACWQSLAPGPDLCMTNPTVAACATARPGAPTFGSAGPPSTWLEDRLGAIASGLSERAPFGYVDQIGDEFTESVTSGHLADTSAVEWCMDVPVWRPGDAGGPTTVSDQCVPQDSFSALSPARPLFTALVMVAFGLLMLRTVNGAVGAKGTAE